jgi:hypothetical protein
VEMLTSQPPLTSELIVHSPECQFPPFQLSTFRKINIINMIKTNGHDLNPFVLIIFIIFIFLKVES